MWRNGFAFRRDLKMSIICITLTTLITPSDLIINSNQFPTALYTLLLLTDPQIVERNQSGGELAVEKVVRLIDGPHTRIRIVVGIHAEAERLVVPQWSSAPVAAVMATQYIYICILLD